MGVTEDLLIAFETHAPGGIRAALRAGADPNRPIRAKRPIDWLVEMYLRSNRFPECLRVMLDAGASLDDPMLETILLDDSDRLRRVLRDTPADVGRRFHLECSYTSLQGVSALPVAAEYNSVGCARVLLDAGVPVDDRADVDADGIGGQTPLFHTVNSNQDHCRGMMELLVEAGADVGVRLRGLAWGRGFEWETVVFDVTPISYAQCGLYAQFHRREEDVYANVDLLYRRKYGTGAPVRNVPNRYLAKR